jgi:glycine/serine hydroxymethyltransferase
MTLIDDEIFQLQLRIIELEKQKKEKDENDKKTNMEHNFNIINELLNEKKTNIKNNRYAKDVPLARYYDQQLVTHLEAIYNILQIVDKRLKKLEINDV